MAPLTKDTLDAVNPAAASAPPSGIQSKPVTGHMRSEAVSLEVPVRVHGSKVKDVVLGTTPHTEPFEEQTSTMIIFSGGGVVRMNTPVGVGQMLVLTNLKTRQDAICRVIKVRPNPKLAAYVEVEFTHSQPGYWGVFFPSDSEPEPPKPVPQPEPQNQTPVVTPVAEESLPEKSAPEVSWAPAPPSQPLEASPVATELKPAEPPPVPRFVPPPKPEPIFAQIGSQEDVQPAASATTYLETRRESVSSSSSKSPAPLDLPPAPLAPPPATLPMSELRGDEDHGTPSNAAEAVDILGAHDSETSFAPAPPAESSHSTFGSLTGGEALAPSSNASAETFGARLDSSFGASSGQPTEPRMNWMLVAAGIGVLITVVGGGLYFRGRSSSNRPATANAPVATQQSSPSLSQSASQSAPASSAPTNSAPAPAVITPAQPPQISPAPNFVAQTNLTNAPSPASSANPASSASRPAAAAAVPPATAKPVAPKVTPDMMSSALNAHPAQVQRGDDGPAGAAPVLDSAAASESGSSTLSGLTAAARVPALPPPSIQPEGPVKIGGDVKEPRLISSALPVYPIGARQAGVEGDVVVNTTIDKNGNVVGMKVLSGPALLRQAALDALRRWKYEPSRLDGQPVAVEMQVTIKFRR